MNTLFKNVVYIRADMGYTTRRYFFFERIYLQNNDYFSE